MPIIVKLYLPSFRQAYQPGIWNMSQPMYIFHISGCGYCKGMAILNIFSGSSRSQNQSL